MRALRCGVGARTAVLFWGSVCAEGFARFQVRLVVGAHCGAGSAGVHCGAGTGLARTAGAGSRAHVCAGFQRGSNSWTVAETAVLALGAIARSCLHTKNLLQ